MLSRDLTKIVLQKLDLRNLNIKDNNAPSSQKEEVKITQLRPIDFDNPKVYPSPSDVFPDELSSLQTSRLFPN